MGFKLDVKMSKERMLKDVTLNYYIAMLYGKYFLSSKKPFIYFILFRPTQYIEKKIYILSCIYLLVLHRWVSPASL